jgi:hypothetical protein
MGPKLMSKCLRRGCGVIYRLDGRNVANQIHGKGRGNTAWSKPIATVKLES